MNHDYSLFSLRGIFRFVKKYVFVMIYVAGAGGGGGGGGAKVMHIVLFVPIYVNIVQNLKY